MAFDIDGKRNRNCHNMSQVFSTISQHVDNRRDIVFAVPFPPSNSQVGMHGDPFPIKAPKECSKKFAATFKGKFPTRGNVLRIFFLFLEDFRVPL